MNMPVITQLLFMTTYLVTENMLEKHTPGLLLGCSEEVRPLTHLSCNPCLVSMTRRQSEQLILTVMPIKG